MDAKLTFKVQEYDAPLDLILNLLSKHKLNIFDIDLTSLLEQYMSAISLWREKNLDVASEFLEMASRLVHMKTISLLPRHEEESERLRQELSGQLIEYRLCKVAAEQLGLNNLSGDIFVRRPMPVEIDETYVMTHPAGILFSALTDALGKNARRMPPPRESFEPLVSKPVVSVTSKIFSVLRLLRRDGKIKMDRLFTAQTGKSGMVATFLAVLELVKSKKIVITGKNTVAIKK
ncbi:MAG: segregation/condensation protein A [Oscillospiraceae bacterium]|nr:segregation/condensation protein A [Oscillospiraceae bacterium]